MERHLTRDEYLAEVRSIMAIEPCSPETLRDIAGNFEFSAEFCKEKGFIVLVERDRRIAAAMRYAADFLEKQLGV